MPEQSLSKEIFPNIQVEPLLAVSLLESPLPLPKLLQSKLLLLFFTFLFFHPSPALGSSTELIQPQGGKSFTRKWHFPSSLF